MVPVCIARKYCTMQDVQKQNASWWPTVHCGAILYIVDGWLRWLLEMEAMCCFSLSASQPSQICYWQGQAMKKSFSRHSVTCFRSSFLWDNVLVTALRDSNHGLFWWGYLSSDILLMIINERHVFISKTTQKSKIRNSVS